MMKTLHRIKPQKYGTQEGVMGIAVGVHGVVDHNQVTYSPFFDYSGIDLADMLG